MSQNIHTLENEQTPRRAQSYPPSEIEIREALARLRELGEMPSPLFVKAATRQSGIAVDDCFRC